jgi:DNA-binding response OmpR family regulator
VDSSRKATFAHFDTVLVVEGEVLARTVLAHYLRDCGYRVLEAAHAQEATTILQEETIRVDVILSSIDLSDPGDGFRLSQWVKAHRPDTPILLAGTLERAASAVGDLCEEGPMLAKPYEPKTVLDRIKQLLAKRASRNPSKL